MSMVYSPVCVQKCLKNKSKCRGCAFLVIVSYAMTRQGCNDVHNEERDRSTLEERPSMTVIVKDVM